LNTNVSQSSINSDMRKSNIMLGTDKRFKNYKDVMSMSQDGFRIPLASARKRHDGSAMSLLKRNEQSRLSLDSTDKFQNLRRSSIQLGYSGNQMFND
jgi:hypothetical protein